MPPPSWRRYAALLSLVSLLACSAKTKDSRDVTSSIGQKLVATASASTDYTAQFDTANVRATQSVDTAGNSVIHTTVSDTNGVARFETDLSGMRGGRDEVLSGAGTENCATLDGTSFVHLQESITLATTSATSDLNGAANADTQLALDSLAAAGAALTDTSAWLVTNTANAGTTTEAALRIQTGMGDISTSLRSASQALAARTRKSQSLDARKALDATERAIFLALDLEAQGGRCVMDPHPPVAPPIDASTVLSWPFDDLALPFASKGAGGATPLGYGFGQVAANAPGVFGTALDVAPGGVTSGRSNVNPSGSSFSMHGWIYPRDYGSGSAQIVDHTYGPSWPSAGKYGNGIVFLPSHDGGWQVAFYQVGNAQIYFNVSTPIPLNTWSHIGVTFDGATLVAYLNGVQVASTTQPGAIDWGTDGSWQLGGNSLNNSDTWNGRLDDWRVESAVRSADYLHQIVAGRGPIVSGPPGAKLQPATASPPIEPSTLLSWTFEEGSTTFASQGSGATTPLHAGFGSVTPSLAGVFGSGVDFANGGITTGPSNVTPSPSAFSIHGWVFPRDYGAGSPQILNHTYGPSWPTAGKYGNGIVFMPSHDGAWQCGFYQVGGASLYFNVADPIPLNVWSHIAVTFDGTTLVAYRNGVQVASAVQPGPVDWGTDGSWQLGGNSLNGADSWVGRVDDWRVENGARSAAYLRGLVLRGSSAALPATPANVSQRCDSLGGVSLDPVYASVATALQEASSDSIAYASDTDASADLTRESQALAAAKQSLDTLKTSLGNGSASNADTALSLKLGLDDVSRQLRDAARSAVTASAADGSLTGRASFETEMIAALQAQAIGAHAARCAAGVSVSRASAAWHWLTTNSSGAFDMGDSDAFDLPSLDAAARTAFMMYNEIPADASTKALDAKTGTFGCTWSQAVSRTGAGHCCDVHAQCYHDKGCASDAWKGALAPNCSDCDRALVGCTLDPDFGNPYGGTAGISACAQSSTARDLCGLTSCWRAVSGSADQQYGASLTSDSTDCGACGNVCGATSACTNGVCTASPVVDSGIDSGSGSGSGATDDAGDSATQPGVDAGIDSSGTGDPPPPGPDASADAGPVPPFPPVFSGPGVTSPQAPSCGAFCATGRPSPRDSAVAGVDPTSGSLVLFGGENGGAALGDTWTWDHVTSLWSVSYAAAPSARAGATMAYDAARKRFVLFGGMARDGSSDLYMGDTWEYDPAARTWQMRASASGPAARAYSAMAFDSARNRVALVGGRGPTGAVDAGDLWEWDGGAGAWSKRTTTGAPTTRAEASLVFDASRAMFVLFGGETVASPSLGIPLDDTWELSSATGAWSSITTNGRPPARVGHAMAFDSARQKAVLFGGTNQSNPNLQDTWDYDGVTATWTDRTAAIAPPARAGHVLAYDASASRVRLAGGLAYSRTGTGSPALDDLWELDPATGVWTARTGSSSPSLTRRGAAYDSKRHRFIVRGDETHPAMWELDSSTGVWTSADALTGIEDYGANFLNASRNELSAVSQLVFDPVRVRTALISTNTVAMPRWEWDGASWQQFTCANAPLGLGSSALAFDAARQVTVVFGGYRGSPYPSNDLWEIDSSTCSWRARGTSNGPPGRASGLLAFDSSRNVSVLFGGVTGGPGTYAQTNDTWTWDGVTNTWTQLTTPVAPIARYNGSLAFDGRRNRTVLFGGSDSNGNLLNDTWELDTTAGAWTLVTPPLAPSPRQSTSIAFDSDRGRVVLFGGRGPGDAHLGDLWEWDGLSWTRRIQAASPIARSGVAGGWDAAKGFAVMFGGIRGDGERAYLQDTWVWRDGEWSFASSWNGGGSPDKFATTTFNNNPLFITQTPSARAGHAFGLGLSVAPQSSNTVGLLFGGEGDAGLLADTWTWDDATFAWTELATLTNHPSPRAEHAIAVMPNVAYLVFGGIDAHGAALGDSWTWALSTGWVGPLVGGASPAARSSTAMVTDTVRGKVVLYGGRDASGALSDTWEWDVATAQAKSGWTRRAPAASPPALFGHRLSFDASRNRVVLTGGSSNDPNFTSSDVWEWDGTTWTLRQLATASTGRVGHFSFYDPVGDETVLFGGLAYRQHGSAAVTFGDTIRYSNTAFRDPSAVLYPNGEPCADGSTCGSGQCVDGVCCENACTGQCGACNVPGSEGQCVAAVGVPHGARPACVTNNNLCPLTCNGTDRAACHSTVGRLCSAGYCAAGVATADSTCNANGACSVPPQSTCAACTGAICAQSCTDGSQCAATSFCGAGACRPYAKLTSVVSVPSTVKLGSTLTLSATASGAQPVYRYSITSAGGALGATTAYFCTNQVPGQPVPFVTASTCTVKLDQGLLPLGQAAWEIEVIDAQSDAAHTPNDSATGTFTVEAQ